jgi:hypothetical protein
MEFKIAIEVLRELQSGERLLKMILHLAERTEASNPNWVRRNICELALKFERHWVAIRKVLRPLWMAEVPSNELDLLMSSVSVRSNDRAQPDVL